LAHTSYYADQNAYETFKIIVFIELFVSTLHDIYLFYMVTTQTYQTCTHSNRYSHLVNTTTS